MAPKYFGKPRADAPNGEQSVFGKLREYLPDESVIFYEPRVNSRRLSRKPDFVIVHPAWGVTVLEVKDWRARDLKGINKTQVLLHNGKTQTSPVEQARSASEVLHELLEKQPELLNYSGQHAGKLGFPYRHAGVLPYIGGKPLRKIKNEWGAAHVIGANELEKQDAFLEAMEKIKPRYGYMTERHIQVVCNILDPTRFRPIRDKDSGDLRGFYDREQVDIATSDLESHVMQEEQNEPDLKQMPLWVDDMPEKARDTALRDSYVRLVRGFAGTGKTDVLLLRARYVHQQYPDLDLLVTTFNKPLDTLRLRPELKDCGERVTVRRFMQLCNEIYDKQRKQQGHQDQYNKRIIEVRSVVWELVRQDEIDLGDFTPDFVDEEITWMKEIGRTTREAYVESVREGRGSGSDGVRLSRQMKEKMFDIFEAYQERLAASDRIDWADLPAYALRYLEDGGQPPKQYDMILIDEAQHFAPTWVGVIRRLLKPGGTLFMCEDPSQSVYRYFSWKQRGLNVRGTRTRWLRTPYRNTRQIFQAAFALIENNEVAQRLLYESGEAVQPDMAHKLIREGFPPEVRRFWQWRDERKFIAEEIDRLIASGIPGREIAILHRDNNILRRYEDAVGRAGVQIFETRKQTGLEYLVVFVPSIDVMFPKQTAELSEDEIPRQQLEFYMTMTRAREKLYLSYVEYWPEFLDPIKPFVREAESTLSL